MFRIYLEVKMYINKLFIIAFLSLISLILPKNILAGVVINEFSVDPTDKYDWVEIFTDETIDLSGWKLSDETGEFFTFDQGFSLSANSYYVVTKYQRLNNDKDTIYLNNKEGTTVDSIAYGYDGKVCLPTSEGSIARLPDGNATYDRVSTATKGSANPSTTDSPCPSPTPAPTNTPTNTSTPTLTSTPTTTKEPTNTPAKTKTPTPEDVGENLSLDNNLGQQRVLGEEYNTSPTPSLVNQRDEQSSSFPLLAFIFIIAGGLFIGASLFLYIKQKKRNN